MEKGPGFAGAFLFLFYVGGEGKYATRMLLVWLGLGVVGA